MAGDQKQQNSWEKLRQPDQAKVQGAFSYVINLPSHRDCLHLDCGHDQETRNLEKHEVGMRKCYASSSGVGGRRH
jgi:hypothetical protein